MSGHHPLTQRDHKKIGKLLSQGVPFHRALHDVQIRSPSNKHASGFARSSGLTGSYKSTIQEIIAMLELISGAFTVIAIMSLFATYGFTIIGLIVVGGYLLFWELVGTMFDQARKRTPTPLRFMVTIIEEIFEIST